MACTHFLVFGRELEVLQLLVIFGVACFIVGKFRPSARKRGVVNGEDHGATVVIAIAVSFFAISLMKIKLAVKMVVIVLACLVCWSATKKLDEKPDWEEKAGVVNPHSLARKVAESG